MRYLKLFEELHSKTYTDAANKLKSMGHERRAKVLDDWAKEVRKRESIQKWSKFGTYKMSFYTTKWDSKTRTASHQPLFEANCYIGFYLNYDNIWDCIQDMGSDGESNLWLAFAIGVFPADEESQDKFNSVDYIKNAIGYSGGFWDEELQIKLSDAGWVIKPKSEVYFNEFENIKYIFSSRKDAIQFHRILMKVLKLEIPTQPYYTDGRGTLSEAKTLIEERSNDKDIWSKIVSSVERLPLNYLYRD